MTSCWVEVAGQRVYGSEESCRTLFLAAVGAAKRSTTLALSADLMVFVSPSTSIQICVPGGFADDFDPNRVVRKTLATRSRSVIN